MFFNFKKYSTAIVNKTECLILLTELGTLLKSLTYSLQNLFYCSPDGWFGFLLVWFFF